MVYFLHSKYRPDKTFLNDNSFLLIDLFFIGAPSVLPVSECAPHRAQRLSAIIDKTPLLNKIRYLVLFCRIFIRLKQ